MLKNQIAKLLPTSVLKRAREFLQARRKRQFEQLPKLTKEDFKDLLNHKLNVKDGDVVFVHSSTNKLNLDFSPFGILPILRDVVGEQGMLLFPSTHLREHPIKALESHSLFDVAKSTTMMGLVNERARRNKDAKRSRHPILSVAALGPNAAEFVDEHHLVIDPCGPGSPYEKLIHHDALIIGLGVTTENLTFVHCVEDVMQEKFPIQTRTDKIYSGRVRLPTGEEIQVPTRAPHPNIEYRNVPRFIKKHISNDVCHEFQYSGMNFFTARALPLFKEMESLAKRGITIYSPFVKKRKNWKCTS